jgi:hypothetical protein
MAVKENWADFLMVKLQWGEVIQKRMDFIWSAEFDTSVPFSK